MQILCSRQDKKSDRKCFSCVEPVTEKSQRWPQYWFRYCVSILAISEVGAILVPLPWCYTGNLRGGHKTGSVAVVRYWQSQSSNWEYKISGDPHQGQNRANTILNPLLFILTIRVQSQDPCMMPQPCMITIIKPSCPILPMRK